MDLDRISGLKVEELKNFLRLRGLKVSRRKEELVARVFVAIENDVPLQKTAEEVEQEIATEYETKLFVQGTQQDLYSTDLYSTRPLVKIT